MDFFHSNFMLQTPREDNHSQPSASLAPSLHSSTHQEFHGKRPSMPFCEEMNVHGGDELSDDGSQLGEKKRRLNVEQVRTLEKNFELGNKLEPQRKMQLARALGLQPRQIAIWFQNRRARWKTKQLEKDYGLLKRQFDAVKAENNALQQHNHKLHAKIMELKTREPRDINLNKDTEASCSNRSQSSSEIKLDISRTPAVDSPLPKNLNRPGLLGPPSVKRTNGVVQQQLFQNFTEPETHCPKTDQNVKEESLSNVFCGMDDQTGFWPWLEQQNFN